jgi:hypothetical protein
MWRVFLLAKELSASQKGLYSMELSSQSVIWLLITRYLVSFPCIYWRSLVLVYTQAKNTHHAFLHNAKYFFKSLFYNSGTLPAKSCRIFSKCNKVAEKNLTQLKTFDKCVWKKTYWSHTRVNKHATLYRVTHTHFYQALTLNNAKIQCELQWKPKPVCYKNLVKFI